MPDNKTSLFDTAIKCAATPESGNQALALADSYLALTGSQLIDTLASKPTEEKKSILSALVFTIAAKAVGFREESLSSVEAIRNRLKHLRDKTTKGWAIQEPVASKFFIPTLEPESDANATKIVIDLMAMHYLPPKDAKRFVAGADTPEGLSNSDMHGLCYAPSSLIAKIIDGERSQGKAGESMNR